MDGNKDESEHCISLAQKYINEGDRTKALKFLYKAERLYPSQRAKGKIIFGKLLKLLLSWTVFINIQILYLLRNNSILFYSIFIIHMYAIILIFLVNGDSCV